MKASRIARAIAVAAASGLVVSGLAVAAPSSAATKTLVRVVTSNAPTSLNPSTPDTNLTVNSDIAYMTGTGFNYYDNSPKLVRNTAFGKYVVTDQSPFTVKYTLNPGMKYSDGAPIDARDLLFSWVVTSGNYENEAAGVDWDSFVGDLEFVKKPKISADNLSITYVWTKFSPDWELYAPGPSAVHSLVKLVYPNDSAEAAKKRWMNMVNNKNWAELKKLADKWNTAYNILDTVGVNSSTNKNLLVSSGAYTVTAAVAKQSVTLTKNPYFKEAGRVPTIKTVQFKVIDNTTAAAQALNNGEIDVFEGQVTADAAAALRQIKSATVISGKSAVYEHIDMRFDGEGPTRGYSTKATELRKAFLLTVPREEIVEKLIKPITGQGKVLNTITGTFPGEPAHDAIVAGSGIKEAGYLSPVATRIAKAQQIMAKYGYGPNNKLKLRVLWGQPTNTRRTQQAELINLSASKAYFDLTITGTQGWSAFLDDTKFDVSFFAWVKNSTSYTSPQSNYGYDRNLNEVRGNNLTGYQGGDKFNDLLDSLVAPLSQRQVTAKYVAIEKKLIADGYGLTIFQHPAIVAHNKGLSGVKPAPLSPTLVWNFWQWKW